MAASTLNLNAPPRILSDAIMEEIRSWADLPRRIFMQVHYAGKSVEEIAAQSGCGAREVTRILESHELKLRKSLRPFRIR
jgi:DNA-directed RNA polymerase specialized sigma24 family protein